MTSGYIHYYEFQKSYCNGQLYFILVKGHFRVHTAIGEPVGNDSRQSLNTNKNYF